MAAHLTPVGRLVNRSWIEYPQNFSTNIPSATMDEGELRVEMERVKTVAAQEQKIK
jgi:hypothetical protein